VVNRSEQVTADTDFEIGHWVGVPVGHHVATNHRSDHVGVVHLIDQYLSLLGDQEGL